MPEHIRRQLEQWITAYLAAAAPDDPLTRVAAERRALPLYSDIGGVMLLSADGSVWELPWDTELAYLASERAAVLALAIGTKRYPELQELLPVRPASCPDCPECQGAGKFGVGPGSRDRIRCLRCAGLGWVPERLD